ncbi:MAG: hypothetical protein Q9228_007868, partial [Teloschistes exilis]
MQWTDLEGTSHKRIYYQDKSAKIRESAWDNGSPFDAAWQVTTISDAVKPGTHIAAAAGYPHADYDYSPVKNVYYVSPDDELTERQAPSDNPQAWENDNFSGLYAAANASLLAAYWHQNFENSSQELVVLFQEESFANGITQGRYISDNMTSNPWVANNFGFSHPRGSTFAVAIASYRKGKQLMLYTVDDNNKLQQHEYTISDTDLTPSAAVALTSTSCKNRNADINLSTATGLIVDPRVPLAVVAQDNTALYNTVTTRQCMLDTPLANLIIYTIPDRSSLTMNAWNCTTGFLDRTSDIEPLQKANTTFLAL